jgi:hypothetical protein
MVFQNGFGWTRILFNGILKCLSLDFQQKHFFDSQIWLKVNEICSCLCRMFKFLTNFLDEYDVLNESILTLIEEKTMSLLFFIVGMDKFFFSKQLIVS